MVVEGENVLDALSVGESGLDRPWFAKDVCDVGVQIKVRQEGPAMQPIVVHTRRVRERGDVHVVHGILRF
jgi:hypothetical protein